MKSLCWTLQEQNISSSEESEFLLELTTTKTIQFEKVFDVKQLNVLKWQRFYNVRGHSKSRFPFQLSIRAITEHKQKLENYVSLHFKTL